MTVILDEAYVEFQTDDDPDATLDLLADFPNLVVLRTFSKCYGLAGLRVGYAIGSPELPRRGRRRAPALQRQRPRPGGRGGGDPAPGRRRCSRVESTDRRAPAGRGGRCASSASRPPRPRPTSPGSTSATPTRREVVAGLAEREIAVRPGTPLGDPGHIRVSYGTREENDRFLAGARPNCSTDAIRRLAATTVGHGEASGHDTASSHSRLRRRARPLPASPISGDLARRPAWRHRAAPIQRSAGRRSSSPQFACRIRWQSATRKYDFSGLEKGEGKMIIGMQEGANETGSATSGSRKVVELAPPATLLEELPLGEERAKAVVAGARRSRRRPARRGRPAAGRGRPLQRPRPESGARLRAAGSPPSRASCSDELLVVMRVYFEKPRTTTGWKGLINDPHLDGSGDVNAGLRIARKLLLRGGRARAADRLRVPRPDHAAVHLRRGRLGRDRRPHDREPDPPPARLRPLDADRLQEPHRRQHPGRGRRGPRRRGPARLRRDRRRRHAGDPAHHRQPRLPHHPPRRPRDAELPRARGRGRAGHARRSPVCRSGW